MCIRRMHRQFVLTNANAQYTIHNNTQYTIHNTQCQRHINIRRIGDGLDCTYQWSRALLATAGALSVRSRSPIGLWPSVAQWQSLDRSDQAYEEQHPERLHCM
jgi:hypothetical protein